MAICTKEIGDGLLPNRYWVTISSDYYYFNASSGSFDWISDLNLFPVKSKTIKVFPSYKMAKGWIENNLYLGIEYDNIKVNFIAIEDRLSGELFSTIKELLPYDGDVNDRMQFEDLHFTIEKMVEVGAKFN
jgi:hypothetical protein